MIKLAHFQPIFFCCFLPPIHIEFRELTLIKAKLFWWFCCSFVVVQYRKEWNRKFAGDIHICTTLTFICFFIKITTVKIILSEPSSFYRTTLEFSTDLPGQLKLSLHIKDMHGNSLVGKFFRSNSLGVPWNRKIFSYKGFHKVQSEWVRFH